MLFCICLPNIVEIGRKARELWRHIECSRWRPQSQKSTPGFRFSDDICLRSWNSNCNSISGIDFDACVVIGMSFYIFLPNSVVIGRSATELWRNIDFSRWLPCSRKSTYGLRFSGSICLRRRAKFRWDISIHSGDKITYCFEKRTAVILEFYFRFRFRPM